MKKTIAKTKLVLNQETVRSLASHELRLAGGGLSGRTVTGGGPCSAAQSGCAIGVSNGVFGCED
jgi:hypothetical protein